MGWYHILFASTLASQFRRQEKVRAPPLAYICITSVIVAGVWVNTPHLTHFSEMKS